MTRDEEHSRPVLGNDVNQCLMCKHLVKMGIHFNRGGSGWRCAAFGYKDIPDEIVTGRWDHREPWIEFKGGYGDNGLLFEDANNSPYTYEDLAGPVQEFDCGEAGEKEEEEEEERGGV